MIQRLRSIRGRTILCTLGILCLGSPAAVGQMVNSGASFDSARPIWPAGRETEKNLFVGFRAMFDGPQQDPVLRIAASSLYRVYLNGHFVGHGPARGPHGYYRVDEWPLGPFLSQKNTMAIEVAGYNANSYYLLDQPAFLQAEVVAGGTVLASTAGKGANFEAIVLKHRLQKVQRYSFQRPFIEYYRMNPSDGRWWEEPPAESARASCSVLPARKLLIRRVAYPRFEQRRPVRIVSQGQLQRDVPVSRLWKDRSLVNIGPQLKGYPENELEVVPSIELQKIQSVSVRKLDELYQPDKAVKLGENAFAILDLGTNLTGFIGARVECSNPTKLYVTFDEILTKDDVDFKRLGCVNAIGYELQPGTYRLESFEPYTMRYLKLNVLAGACQVRSVYLREYANSETGEASFSCSDPRLNRIFQAARQTFRQNAIDIFMDCPSRERAGWLCDSFFTSRVAFDLCGNTTIEKNFFENYLLPPGFAHLPDGMLPMCYPADHNDGVYIPNWALWFVIDFGPKRSETKAFPEIHPANAFVGNYLRSELLSRYGQQAQIEKELVDYYLYMADQTGTLWENVGAYASCDHGFASHVAHSLYRDVLGVREVDAQKKVVRLRIADVGLDWCEGTLPTPDGPVIVSWRKENGKIVHRADLPAGYLLQDDSLTVAAGLDKSIFTVNSQLPAAGRLRTVRYTPRSTEEAKAWQNSVRARLAALLKIDDLLRGKDAIPLAPKILSTADKGSYRVEEIEISSTVGRRIRVIVTVPIAETRDAASMPAVVCIGGHGSDLYSPYDGQTVSKDAAKAKADRIYRGFGTALAGKGYVTISTTVSQHEVYEPGRLLMGERLWDLMRCVDYLRSLPHVDPSRIGCAGLSLGGEMVMWLGAMDERIAGAVSAGFLTTMDSMEQNHCTCWKFDGLRELVDYADIYSLTAPRPLQCQNGLLEPPSQFYVPRARQAMEEVRLIYRDMDRPENVVLDVHDEGHVIDLPALIYFFEKHLRTGGQ